MTLHNETTPNVWRVLDIDHDKNTVILVSSSTPTVKRYSVPTPIQWAQVDDQVLRVYCETLVLWEIQVSDGARRKLKHQGVS
jgi:hypothetical protein